MSNNNNENTICKDCDFSEYDEEDDRKTYNLDNVDLGCLNYSGIEDCPTGQYNILKTIIYSYIIFKVLSMLIVGIITFSSGYSLLSGNKLYDTIVCMIFSEIFLIYYSYKGILVKINKYLSSSISYKYNY